VSGNENPAQSKSSCPSWGLLWISHPSELECASASGSKRGWMGYANEVIWSSTFPFLPTVGVRALSSLKEPTGNAMVTLYDSLVVRAPVSLLRLVIQNLLHYKHKKPNFLLLLLSFSSSYHTA